MKTVGTIIREARLSRNLTLEEIEAATRIRKKFLQAIEKDDYSVMPSITYAKGFVRNYAAYVGLNPTNIMAFFRRQTAEVAKSSLLPRGMAEPLNASLIRLTPARFIGFIVTILIFLFAGYFFLQYRRVSQPPYLEITSPKNGAMMDARKAEVLGKTDPDATVSVNGTSILVRSDGQFFEQVELNIGENTITVVSTSRFGKTATRIVNITYLE